MTRQIGMVGTGQVRTVGGVVRGLAPLAGLEGDARLLGRLAPPMDGVLPAGLAMRTDANGTRVLTINLHMGVPGDQPLRPANERIEALRDVARHVNALNPDVVLTQELRNRPLVPGKDGITDMVSSFGHLIKADDVAFTPAVVGDPVAGDLQHYGTAIYTRNGFTIDQAANVALPNADGQEARSAGIAAVRAPDSRPSFTVVSTHLAYRTVEDAPLRDAQLGALLPMLDDIRATGSFSYVDAITGERQLATGYSGQHIVLGGDLNEGQDAADRVLVGGGLSHVFDTLAGAGTPDARDRAATASSSATLDHVAAGHPPRIDHLYGAGWGVTDVAVTGVPRVEHPGPATDHLGVVADLVPTS